MTEWTLLKRLLDSVHQHSTMIGRLWLTVMVIFRLLVVAVATDDVYTDEQEMFVCNTLQPGCPTVCYDAFAPISQPRFWVFHIISVSTPSLCFIVYTWHSLSKRPCPQRWALAHRRNPTPWGRWDSREVHDIRCDSDSCSVRSHQHLGHHMADELEGVASHDLQGGDQNNVASSGPTRARALREGPAEAPGVSGGVLSTCYVLHVCLRAVLEAGFVLAQWRLFGFRVPIRFQCSASPCSQAVDCYVSRPTEKTVFLLFMFCVGVFCILLNLLELNHLGWKKIRQALRLRAGPSWGGPTKGGYETFHPDSPSLTSTLGFGDGTSTTSLPTLDLVVGHQPDWTVVNCGRMRESEGVTETRPECNRGERQPLKTQKDSRGSQQKSAEVWI